MRNLRRQAASLPPLKAPGQQASRPPSGHTRASSTATMPPNRASGPPEVRASRPPLLDRIPARHLCCQAASCRPLSSRPAGIPGHERPQARPPDRARAAKRASCPPTCGRPCYPCSTLTHSNGPARAPAGFLQYRAGLCGHLSKSGVHRSQAGTWVLASYGSAGRASFSRPVVSAKVYFTTGDDRRSARQGTSPQDPEKYIKAGRHNGEGR